MISFFLFGVACGKRGPSLPPIVIAPDKCGDLMIRQLGDSLIIAFSLPEKNTDGSPLAVLPSVELLMYVSEGEAEEPRLDEFLKGARQLKIPLNELDDTAIGKKVFVEKKLLDLSPGKSAGMRYTMAARFVNRKKRISPLSDISSITIVKPLEPPRDLLARSEEKGIRLSWQASLSEKAQSCGSLFNIYRIEFSLDELSQVNDPDLRYAEEMRHQSIPLNQKPISERSYFDESCLFGKMYLYSVREVCDASLPLRESDNSNIVCHSHRDEFPPAPPSGLAAVSEEGIIRLFWFPSAENDCAGYKVYRKSENENAYSMIAALPVHRTSFSDKDVIPYAHYCYYVTAIDTAPHPNESHPSEVVYETASNTASTEEKVER